MTLEEIQSGEIYVGNEIKYFIDVEKEIGEVYLDGNLIFQSLDASNEPELENDFRSNFIINNEDLEQSPDHYIFE